MSFFNKLTSKLDELNLGPDKKDRERDVYPPQQQYPPPSQQYGGNYNQPQGYPDQHQSSYSSPSRSLPLEAIKASNPQQYNSPPPPSGGPTYSPPPDKPPIPAGWLPQYDQHYQRWYYVEEATQRSQWEAPGVQEGDNRGWGSQGGSGYPPHGAPGYGGYESHGPSHGGHDSGHGSHGYGYSDHGGYGEESHKGKDKDKDKDKKKKKGHNGAMYAAGGLAAGVIGGALIANALDDSDDERHGGGSYASAPAPAPVYEPTYNAEGEYVDQSDRESVRSAREDYEKALAEANDSSASSSEEEELEEAREEYEEEYEEAYDD